MENKTFSQNEVNRIVATRVKRERERLNREFDNCLKRCMASIHLTLHQEMCLLKRNIISETKDTFLSDTEKLK